MAFVNSFVENKKKNPDIPSQNDLKFQIKYPVIVLYSLQRKTSFKLVQVTLKFSSLQSHLQMDRPHNDDFFFLLSSQEGCIIQRPKNDENNATIKNDKMADKLVLQK